MKYKIEVKKTNEYEIEFDESVWTESYIEEWDSIFQDAFDLEDSAEHLSYLLMQEGPGGFIEGFGHVKTFYPDGEEFLQFDGLTVMSEDMYAEGVVVRLKSPGEEFEYETTEIQ